MEVVGSNPNLVTSLFNPKILIDNLLVTSFTMCVSTFQVDFCFVLRTVLLHILLPQSRFSDFGRLRIFEKNCPAF